MLKQTYKNKDEFVKFYAKQLENVNKVRIIPLSTADLSLALQLIIENGVNDSNLNILSDEIKEELCGSNEQNTTNGFIFGNSKDLQVNLEETALNDAIKNTFNNGTIIAMYADMDGNIYLDDTIIGRIIDRKTNSVANREKIMDVMQESFLNVIGQLYSSNVFQLSD